MPNAQSHHEDDLAQAQVDRFNTKVTRPGALDKLTQIRALISHLKTSPHTEKEFKRMNEVLEFLDDIL